MIPRVLFILFARLQGESAKLSPAPAPPRQLACQTAFGDKLYSDRALYGTGKVI